jgi:glutathione synthase/RimK-type ligase-like ATP-grasp enzyme
MNPPDDIALMFDKPACQARFADAGQPIPRPLGLIEDGPQCRAAAQSKGGGRVFLKLAHGSAGSGVMAYRWSGQGQQAVTSVQVELGQGGEVKLYNTRHLETLTQAGEIDRLIEHLGRHRLYGETWMPKASLRGKSFDLRVLVIAGQVAHSVARLSKGPITNLHLLNERLNIEAALEDIPAALWEDIQKTCCHLMGVCFPKSLYAGFDVMISGGMQHYYVLEANAFGDLLKGVYHQGRDTYTQEILAMLERGSC